MRKNLSKFRINLVPQNTEVLVKRRGFFSHFRLFLKKDCSDDLFGLLKNAVKSILEVKDDSKFLQGEGGQKFATEVYSKGNIQQTFRNRYMIDADLGRVVGTRGETGGRIIIDRETGKVITQFPRRGR